MVLIGADEEFFEFFITHHLLFLILRLFKQCTATTTNSPKKHLALRCRLAQELNIRSVNKSNHISMIDKYWRNEQGTSLSNERTLFVKYFYQMLHRPRAYDIQLTTVFRQRLMPNVFTAASIAELTRTSLQITEEERLLIILMSPMKGLLQSYITYDTGRNRLSKCLHPRKTQYFHIWMRL